MPSEGAVSVVSATPHHAAGRRLAAQASPVQLNGQRVAGTELRRVRPVPETASESSATGTLTRGVNASLEPGEHMTGQKRCYCEPCRAISRRSTKRWKLRVARGEIMWGDIEAVRAHVSALGALGMGKQVVARQAGVASPTVGHLFYQMGHQKRTERVTYRVAQRLLAVRFDVRLIPPFTTVDSTGARRRLQALLVAGWPISCLAEKAGMTRQQFRRYLFRERYAAKNCVLFIDLFEQLWRKTPPRMSDRAKARHAAMIDKYEWMGIGAWDDDTVDDPTATPQLGDWHDPELDPVLIEAVFAGRAKFTHLNEAERIEFVRLWDDRGNTKTAFEKKLNVPTRTSGKYFALAVPDYQRKSA